MDTNLIEQEVRNVIEQGNIHQIEHALSMVNNMTFTDDVTADMLDRLEQDLRDALNPPSKAELLRRALEMQANFYEHALGMDVRGIP